MKRIMIPTITQPDTPNVNNVIYSKDVWNKYIESIDNGNLMIPLTLSQEVSYLIDGVPYDKIIGWVNRVADTYVIATLIDYEERLKDHPLTIDMINEYIIRIQDGKIKAYMNYYGDVQIESDMACRYISRIHRIAYFHLGNADPHDMRPFEFNPTKIKRHNKKRK